MNVGVFKVLREGRKGDSAKACGTPGRYGPPPTTVARGESPRARDLIALVPGITAWRVACHSVVPETLET